MLGSVILMTFQLQTKQKLNQKKKSSLTLIVEKKKEKKRQIHSLIVKLTM
jgi:hypothetical protein